MGRSRLGKCGSPTAAEADGSHFSHSGIYRLADKIWGIVAGAVRDDEHRGGKWEQFTGNHPQPPSSGSAGVEDGPVSFPHLHMDTLSRVLLRNQHPLSGIQSRVFEM